MNDTFSECDRSENHLNIDQLMSDRTAVARLLEEHRMLKEAIENSPVACCVYDTDDRLIARNEAYLGLYNDIPEIDQIRHGYQQISYADLVRSKLALKVPEDQLERAVEKRVEAQRGANGTPIERDYGAHGVFRVVKYPLPSGAIAGMAIDITEVKTREAELNEARREAVAMERAKSTFLAQMSHELRTPLNAIMGFSELVQMRLDPNDFPKEVEYLGDVQDSGKHLISLISDLLDLARIEAEEHQLTESPVSVAEVLRAAYTLLLPLAKKRGTALLLGEGAPDIMVSADERALKQILLNLGNNAINYTPEGGTVTLSGDIGFDHTVALSVTDTGPGIPPSELTAIQKPFARGVAEVKAASTGAGLGLSITRALAELHEGLFELESEQGHGTRATIKLPARRTLSVAGVEQPVRAA